jgi:hypothetical protein
MNIRTIGLSLAAVAAISPSLSSASPESASLAACAQAFATKIANPGTPAPRYRVSYLNDASAGTLSLIYSREYTFDLHAKDPKTGLIVSKATCSASREGVVTELTVTPVSISAPQFASRF